MPMARASSGAYLPVGERHLDAQPQHFAPLGVATDDARQLVDVERVGDEGHAADRVRHGELVEHRRLALLDGAVGGGDGGERACDLLRFGGSERNGAHGSPMIH